MLATFKRIISFEFGPRHFQHHKGKGTPAGRGVRLLVLHICEVQVNLQILSQGKTESGLILLVSEKHDKSLKDLRHPWVNTDHICHITIKFKKSSQYTSFKRDRNPCIYGQFWGKNVKYIQWGNNSLFNKWCWANRIRTCKRIRVEFYLAAYIELEPKWISDLNGSSKTIKLLEENRGKSS